MKIDENVPAGTSWLYGPGSQAMRSWMLSVIVAALLIMTSCTARPFPDPSPSPSASASVTPDAETDRPMRTLTVRPGECPDATGYDQAVSNLISIGSFEPTTLGPLQKGQNGHKTWVMSQRKGTDDAVVVVRAPSGKTTTERRPSGESWASGVEQFFPGSIRPLADGVHRISATVGPDSICVKVRYRVSCPDSVTDGEVEGIATPATSLWALLFTSYPLRAGADSKIAWRMTGSGELQVSAIGPDGQSVSPTLAPQAHGGSTWDRPGEEWGSFFTFPTPGCWTLLARRGDSVGALSLRVR